MIKTNITTGINAEKWLKKHIPNWQPDMIRVAHKKYGGFEITFVNNGKLKSIRCYDCEFDLLIPKFTELFNGQLWDECKYVACYKSSNNINNLPIPCTVIYQVSGEYTAPNGEGQFLSEYRSKIDKDVGLMQVPKPTNFFLYHPGTFSTL